MYVHIPAESSSTIPSQWIPLCVDVGRYYYSEREINLLETRDSQQQQQLTSHHHQHHQSRRRFGRLLSGSGGVWCVSWSSVAAAAAAIALSLFYFIAIHRIAGTTATQSLLRSAHVLQRRRLRSDTEITAILNCAALLHIQSRG